MSIIKVGKTRAGCFSPTPVPLGDPAADNYGWRARAPLIHFSCRPGTAAGVGEID